MITLIYYVYLILLMLTCAISVFRFRKSELPLQILAVFLIVTFVTEVLAFLFARWQGNNMPVYGVYALLQSFLICAYFNYSIAVFRVGNTGIKIGGLSLLVGIANSIWLQPLNGSNIYFLYFEGILTIALVLFSFARLMLEESDQRLSSNPHFWIGITLVFFWSLTFCNWALYEYVFVKHNDYYWVVSLASLFINIITYSGLGLVFLFYPKWQSRYE